jgi:hypothetical protein
LFTKIQSLQLKTILIYQKSINFLLLHSTMEHFDEKTDPKVLLHKIKELQDHLHQERIKHNNLTAENKQLKDTLQLSVPLRCLLYNLISQNKFAEEDEECKVNSLIKYVNKLKKEKEDIIQQVEKEEEFITNTLQKKLTQVFHLFSVTPTL